MGPVLEEFLFTPEQIIQMGCVVVSKSTPQNDLMTRRYRADRI